MAWLCTKMTSETKWKVYIHIIFHLTLELDNLVDKLKSRIKQQFTDRRKYGYRLHSVFIHRGI